MPLLIDGYNLLHVTGIVGRGIGPHTLERARGALLNFLAATIEPAEIAHTTVVFDAKDAPPGLPRRVDFKGMTVRFAAEYAEADALIEELIRSDSTPRQLTVVSSDHRLQRAARRRKCTAVDSDRWYADLVRHHRGRQRDTRPDEVKPEAALSPEEVQRWLDEFGDVADWLESEQAAGRSEPTVPSDVSSPPPPPLKPGEAHLPHVDDSPFPPGYAEDLLAEEESGSPFPPGYGEDLPAEDEDP